MDECQFNSFQEYVPVLYSIINSTNMERVSNELYVTNITNIERVSSEFILQMLKIWKKFLMITQTICIIVLLNWNYELFFLISNKIIKYKGLKQFFINKNVNI